MLLFLFMVTCDLRAIFRVGPRVLAVFACAMASILLSIVIVYVLFRGVLPQDGWKMLAALSATWTGGSANLVAVVQATDFGQLAAAGAAGRCAVLLAVGAGAAVDGLVPRRASIAGPAPMAGPYPELKSADDAAADPGGTLLWLGLALFVALGVRALATVVAGKGDADATSWVALIATLAGLLIARNRSRKFPAQRRSRARCLQCSSRRSDRRAISRAWPPRRCSSCAACSRCNYIGLLALAARVFRFDLYLCGISSLAGIGGVASAPVLAATYTPILVPIAVLLAMLGLILGTGIGLFMAQVLSAWLP